MHCVVFSLLLIHAAPRRHQQGEQHLALGIPSQISTVAIGFHGHYLRKEKLIHHHQIGCSIFKNSRVNVTASLLEPFRIKNVSVLTFFHTYESCVEQDRELLDYLRPASYSFSSCLLPRIVDSYIRVLDLIEAHPSFSKVDAIILSRFDARYRLKIDEMPLEWSKLNLAFKDGPVYWRKYHKVSDLFHVLPRSMLTPLRRAFDVSTKRGSSAGHFIYDHIKAVNFIDANVHRSSNVNEGDANATFLVLDRSCAGFDELCAPRKDARCPAVDSLRQAYIAKPVKSTKNFIQLK